MTTKHFYILLFLVFSSGVFSQESTKLVENRINFNVQNSLPRYDGIQFSIRVYLTNNENVFLSQIEQINNDYQTFLLKRDLSMPRFINSCLTYSARFKESTLLYSTVPKLHV